MTRSATYRHAATKTHDGVAMFGSDITYKVLGSVAGTVMSIMALYPANRAEAFHRGVLGIVAGIIFGEAAHEYVITRYFVHMGANDGIVASSALVAFVAWWVFGIVARTLGGYRTVKDVAQDYQQITRIK